MRNLTLAYMIGDHIRRERGRLRMTQEEMAEALGVARRTVQRWESGEAPIPAAQQGRITALLSAREANPLDVYSSVDLLSEVLRRLNPVVDFELIGQLADLIRALSDVR